MPPEGGGEEGEALLMMLPSASFVALVPLAIATWTLDAKE